MGEFLRTKQVLWRPRSRWALGISVVAGLAILAVCLQVRFRSRETSPSWPDLQGVITRASESENYRTSADCRAVVGFLRFLSSQQLQSQAKDGKLPFSVLRADQRDLLLEVTELHPGFFSDVNLEASYLVIVRKPVLTFQWHVSRGGKDDMYSLGFE